VGTGNTSYTQHKKICPICQKRFESIIRPARGILKARITRRKKESRDLPETKSEKNNSPETAFLDEDDKMEEEIFQILLSGRGTRQGHRLFLGLFSQLESMLEEL
jgi:uncharacterized Zn finger protein (UPF0148 family)